MKFLSNSVCNSLVSRPLVGTVPYRFAKYADDLTHQGRGRRLAQLYSVSYVLRMRTNYSMRHFLSMGPKAAMAAYAATVLTSIRIICLK